jgi:exopolyphosphatase / guanosine-5'-triphosphate,3'-diphosphate pyrophosphatase
MTRVAAVDLGTNATRLLVADVVDGTVTEVVRRTRITRLGEGVDRRRKLLPVPIARVRNVLAEFRREAESLGAQRVLAVATSAVRDAENGEAFLGEIEWSYGFATRLLSGDEEAGLTLRGVGPLPPGTLVSDIGGGSTELVSDTFRRSIDIGCVRLTERFGDDLDEAAADIHAALGELPAGIDALLGVDGTTAELAALHGDGSLSRGEVDRLLQRLASLSDEERRSLLLEPERSGVIVLGALILRELLAALGAERVRASSRDLLNGAALAAAELDAPGEPDAPAGAFTCC